MWAQDDIKRLTTPDIRARRGARNHSLWC